ncbi:unnamed protein product [Adineta steineri]|uniref:Uncharacterized protein n=1 Tax=Adineta steineri TaxID=433720 RepID=A0A819XGV9_9BILA|nr:unnamed protein product [Adineta steineri]CAF4141163.1 unnamed protein product [Adineta steineri]
MILATITCTAGYAPTSSGTCVDTQLDFYNCGSVGYVCPSTSRSCSGGTCIPRSVRLVGAVAVSGLSSSNTIDDSTGIINLPVNITFYNYSSSNITVTSNGVLCLDTCNKAYASSSLPSASFAGPTVFAFWADLDIYNDAIQGVYYGVSGSAPNRITTFEFLEATHGKSSSYNQFQITFSENLPNIVECFYIETNSGAYKPTIGVQKSATGPHITYATNRINPVAANTTITFDTNAGTYT